MDVESQKTLDEVITHFNTELGTDIANVFAGLANLEITVGPITIPAFTIKLGKQA